MDNYLKVLEVLNGVIKEVESVLEEKAEVTEEAKWLMSIPGIGFHNALLILSELGEVERFERPTCLVCYAGLAPKVEQSGEQVRYGHINRYSNGFLKEHLSFTNLLKYLLHRNNRFGIVRKVYYRLTD